jgi:hypothetical protein
MILNGDDTLEGSDPLAGLKLTLHDLFRRTVV